ncbi:MAG: DUF4153 domain-containing protein, partial [Acutalibacteraceae bacterium]
MNENNIISQKQKIRLNALDIVACVINFFLTFFLIYNVVWDGYSQKVSFIYIGFFALASAYIISKQKSFSKEAVLPGAAAVIASLSFALHDSPGLNVVIFLMMMYLSGSYCVKLTNSAKHSRASYFYLLDILKCEVLLPLKHIFLPFSKLGTLRKKDKTESDKSRHKKIIGALIGILCALPVLLIVIPLLIDSDAAFETLVGSSFENLSELFQNFINAVENKFDLFEIVLTLIPAVICSTYIFSVMFSFGHGVTKEENLDTSAKYERFRILPANITGGFLGVISLVYLVYLLSQLSYLFSAFFGKLPGGVSITVTEYARRGFFEMAKVAAVNFVIIALTVLFSKRKNNKLSPLIQWFDLFLCVFTMLLIAVSASKILLYISSMGLTEKRLYVFAFDIVLLFVFVSIIIRLFKKNFPYMKVIISALCTVICLLGIIGSGNIISYVNSKMFETGKTSLTVDDFCRNNSYSEFLTLYKLTQSNDEIISESACQEMVDSNCSIIETALEGHKKAYISNLDMRLIYRLIKKEADDFSEIYDNYYTDGYGRMYIFLNTKSKVKSIEVKNNYRIFASDKDPSQTQNFELITFDEDYYGSKDIFEPLSFEKNFTVTVTDENGKTVTRSINANCAEIIEDETGFDVRYIYAEPTSKSMAKA